MPARPFFRILFVAVVAVISHASYAEAAEKRIALVIGNSAYQADPLATSANDAGLIAQSLQAAGFDVVGARDLDAATLRSAFHEFLDKAGASGPETVALVYFAGRGLQFEGENYLVPVDARITRDTDVPIEAFRLTDLTQPLTALPLKARIFILDAARANRFAPAGQPLAGGLALMQPDPGTLIAFNAAPGTIAPESQQAYGAYASALTEMIKEGGLPLDELFERVRLRVNALTNGAEVPWYVSRVEAPFLFFERTSAAPPAQADRFAELMSRPIDSFDVHDAYLAALTRDTLRGYQDFLAAYSNDPLARRVRAIIAVRREAMTWRQTVFADTPDAYWSYLRRYPRGAHADDAHRRLAHFAAALEPPSTFAAIDYDVPPPPPEEIVYVERPVVSFADPEYDLPPPPPVPVFFLPPQPVYFVDAPPPPPPVDEFVLPIPVYQPVPSWIERPHYVAPPPVNVINANIHNNVEVNPASQTVVVTNPAGQQIAPLPTNLLPAQPAAPVEGQPNFVERHPGASAVIGAAAVALPTAALLHARQKAGQSPVQGQSPTVPGQAVGPGQQATPLQATPNPAVNPPNQHPSVPSVQGGQPLPEPKAPTVTDHGPDHGVPPHGPSAAPTPPTLPGQVGPGQQATPPQVTPNPVVNPPNQHPSVPPVQGLPPLPEPKAPTVPDHGPDHGIPAHGPSVVPTPPTLPGQAPAVNQHPQQHPASPPPSTIQEGQPLPAQKAPPPVEHAAPPHNAGRAQTPVVPVPPTEPHPNAPGLTAPHPAPPGQAPAAHPQTPQPPSVNPHEQHPGAAAPVPAGQAPLPKPLPAPDHNAPPHSTGAMPAPSAPTAPAGHTPPAPHPQAIIPAEPQARPSAPLPERHPAPPIAPPAAPPKVQQKLQQRQVIQPQERAAQPHPPQQKQSECGHPGAPPCH
ncbi:caspase family protein [Beijerinckia indica]|uniref:Peptidase C14 caspase catalytic subunit p20 n=1 Tax=Beijerinckia indica subsp. indica (strain ATCC 9039 / DSM 1715 / NCIMB 8712) TaxID=395963 RepID=B2IBS3_BEII9|nr:caspase domain-containing protein [Beijerinckia indica]ACB93795.1 peptidase C14 caspase catalytic subunit p20 [Beijerinckia indica subsp. indica ATCC 9039]